MNILDMKNKNMLGNIYKLNAEYPVYDENEEIIGNTSSEDEGVVIFHNGWSLRDENDYEFIHIKLLKGKFKGYDALQLEKDSGDFEKLQFIKGV